MGQGRNIDIQRDGGVEDARTVQVKIQAVFLYQFRYRVTVIRSQGQPAASVVGVFQTDQSIGRVMDIGRPYRRGPSSAQGPMMVEGFHSHGDEMRIAMDSGFGLVVAAMALAIRD